MARTTAREIGPQERMSRQAALEEALASVRMEGLEPSPAFHAAAARFVAGELSLEEMLELIRPTNPGAQATDPAA
ncbi:MAG TPA: antitoxin VbhA family protein [Bryobacteraceae bacterium]|jgi:hypothetical protein|nr:antitoxin VbhA family protein [Bryobacteraceae bacterium]